MTYLRCVTAADNGNSQAYAIAWILVFSAIIAYFFVLFLYGLLPLLCYRAEFDSLPLMSRFVRISCVVVIGFKSLAYFISLFLGLFLADSSPYDKLSMAGLCLLETACFMVTSCYCVVLLFWLSACGEILPTRYTNITKWVKNVTIGYNGIIYALFLASIILNSGGIKGQADWFTGVVAISRDFGLCLIFGIFLAVLHKGLQTRAPSLETSDETKLYRFSLFLLLALLVRGGCSLGQNATLNEARECRAFLFIVIIQEIGCDGLPFLFLLRVNNAFLVDQHKSGSVYEITMMRSSTYG
jgi:hypothetical protein